MGVLAQRLYQAAQEAFPNDDEEEDDARKVGIEEYLQDGNKFINPFCGECKEEFDHELRKPLLLVCGHTFCQICLFDI
jgi:hypothetical protein